MNPVAGKTRLHVVDALRGFALVSIMLLHNLEHFDVYFLPPHLPEWLLSLDKKIWDSLFFLFAGKSYGIFALLFGLTFYIQLNSRMEKGEDFRGRFAWRLVLLLFFGAINSMFYQGDILTIYALVGFLIIPLAKLSDRALLYIAIILLLQPLEWWNVIHGLQLDPGVKLSDPASWTYFGRMDEYIKGSSFLATVKGNLLNGKLACVFWSWENGRFFHILSLFIFGMLTGRKKLFADSPENKRFWTKTLMVSAISFAVLYVVKENAASFIKSEAVLRPFTTIETSWTNISFMTVLIAGFYLLYQTAALHRALDVFSAIGRMSLSNYILQSVLGSTLYYGFGFALYQYTGATFSLVIGILLAILLGILSTYWAKGHKRGPLEELWFRATWFDKKK